MRANDRDEFFALMRNTAQMYNKLLSPETIELYWEDLLKYDFVAIRDALRRHRQSESKEGGFMPKSHDLIKIMAEDKRKRDAKNIDHRCQFQVRGQRCPMPATISENLRGAFEWCREHYRTRHDPALAEAVLHDAFTNREKFKLKNEIEMIVEEGAEEFRRQARTAGISNYEYFQYVFGREDTGDRKKYIENIKNILANQNTLVENLTH